MKTMSARTWGMSIFLAVLVIGVALTGGCGGEPEKEPIPNGQQAAPPAGETAAVPEEVRPEPGSVTAVHFSELKKFLPEAPSGWVGEEPSGMTMAFEEGAWSVADRHYAKPDAWDESVGVSIMDSAYFMVGPWMMWGMFMEYETTDGYLKSTSFKGYPAWEEHSKPDSYSLHVGVDERFMVSISATGVGRDDLHAFAELIDYQGLAALK